jgi:Fe2+ or Zn2+ uptake regulation protein
MRNTKQKELVYNIVNTNFNHLTAKGVYDDAKKTISNISLGTIYRILNELVDSHKIIRILTKEGIDHFDRIPTSHHNHFICDKCGKIVDLFNVNCTYDISELKDYEIDSIEVIITGLCNDCTKKGK